MDAVCDGVDEGVEVALEMRSALDGSEKRTFNRIRGNSESQIDCRNRCDVFSLNFDITFRISYIRSGLWPATNYRKDWDGKINYRGVREK